MKIAKLESELIIFDRECMWFNVAHSICMEL